MKAKFEELRPRRDIETGSSGASSILYPVSYPVSNEHERSVGGTEKMPDTSNHGT